MLTLRFGSGSYDRMEAILRGIIRPEGIELDFNEINAPRQIFDGMLGGDKFDVSELSSSEYITRTTRGNFPFVAIPVFPSRAFRHGFIFINKRSGIEIPKDLEGKLIGVPQHSQTAAVWIRGHLQHDHGVDLSTLRWLEGSVEVAGEHARIETTSPTVPPMLEPNETGESMSDLLAAGEIDAIDQRVLAVGRADNQAVEFRFAPIGKQIDFHHDPLVGNARGPILFGRTVARISGACVVTHRWLPRAGSMQFDRNPPAAGFAKHEP